ncbi:hypothetical protein AB0D42_13985 [Streptomyces sp. NPDC048304]|jgi:hypothetical protein|uniref:hypothetical protein n=1 Tax=unclassified Streptomyces TaxID=2593676 RepID=UPI0033FDA9F4
MRSIASRTKTVLVALTGTGVIALGAAAAVPAAGVPGPLVRVAADLTGHPAHPGPALADDRDPFVVAR